MSNRFTPEGRPEDFKKYGDLTFDKMWKDGTHPVIPTEQLLHPDIPHAFLVRTPKKAVPS